MPPRARNTRERHERIAEVSLFAVKGLRDAESCFSGCSAALGHRRLFVLYAVRFVRRGRLRSRVFATAVRVIPARPVRCRTLRVRRRERENLSGRYR